MNKEGHLKGIHYYFAKGLGKQLKLCINMIPCKWTENQEKQTLKQLKDVIVNNLNKVRTKLNEILLKKKKSKNLAP